MNIFSRLVRYIIGEKKSNSNDTVIDDKASGNSINHHDEFNEEKRNDLAKQNEKTENVERNLNEDIVLDIRNEFIENKKYDIELVSSIAERYNISSSTVDDIFMRNIYKDSAIPRKYKSGTTVKVTNKKLKLYGCIGTVHDIKDYINGIYTVNINNRTVRMKETNFKTHLRNNKKKSQ